MRKPRLPSSASSTIETASTPTGNFSLRWRRFWPECLDAFGTSSCDLTVGKVARVKIRVKVRVGQFGANGEPARSNGAVATEQVQPSSAKTEMLDYVKYLDGLLYGTVLGLFRYDQIYIDVRVNEIAVGGSSDGSFDAHQTVFFRSLKNRFTVQIFAVSRVIDVRSNPTNVLASSEAPFAKAKTSHI